MLFALTGFQKTGALIVAAAFVVTAIFLLFQLFASGREPGSEITHAPNRKPYYDDNELETTRLDRFLGACLFLLIISAVGLPLYFLNESSRQENATKALAAEAEVRGSNLYKSFCEKCHAAGGVGGSAPSTVNIDPADKTSKLAAVKWTAPPLNTVLYRFDPNEINHIITYGRPNTPMPAWGVEGGGAMNAQQVTDLVAYLGTIQLSQKEVLAQTDEVSVTGYVYPYAEAPKDNGERLFARYCARCHTKGWSYAVPDGKGGFKSGDDPEDKSAHYFQPEIPGGGAFGPSLRDGSTVRQFPLLEDQVDFVFTGSQPDKAYGARGVGSIAGGGMPGFGMIAQADEFHSYGRSLTDKQIRAIVEYERSLGEPGGTQ